MTVSATLSKFSLRSQIAGGALALTLVALSGPLLAAAQAPADQVEAQISAGHADKAIREGEAALAKDPRDGALRAALGRAYLKTGRFESAASMLSDAQSLGSINPRLALNLALAQIATGHGADALGVLDQARDSLPVPDFGLAVALAGDTGRGVAVLTDALRAGDTSARLRQNLAYAYALDGHWAEARTVLQTDLTDNQIDTRLTQWAAQARPEAARDRVASLLGVQNHKDAGVPAQLALGGATKPASLAVAQPSAAPVANGGELPAVSAPATPQTPVTQPVAAPAPQPANADSNYTQPSFAQVTPSHAPTLAVRPMAAPAAVKPAAAPAAVNADAQDSWRTRFAAMAVHHPIRAMRAAPAKAPHIVAVPARPALAMAGATAGAMAGGHVVQLGAFSNAQNAERAKRYFLTHNAAFKGHQLIVTKAAVNGRAYWRVAASGYTTVAAASGSCSTVKKRGGACFAYAAGSKSTDALAMVTPKSTRGR